MPDCDFCPPGISPVYVYNTSDNMTNTRGIAWHKDINLCTQLVSTYLNDRFLLLDFFKIPELIKFFWAFRLLWKISLHERQELNFNTCFSVWYMWPLISDHLNDLNLSRPGENILFPDAISKILAIKSKLAISIISERVRKLWLFLFKILF